MGRCCFGAAAIVPQCPKEYDYNYFPNHIVLVTASEVNELLTEAKYLVYDRVEDHYTNAYEVRGLLQSDRLKDHAIFLEKTKDLRWLLEQEHPEHYRQGTFAQILGYAQDLCACACA